MSAETVAETKAKDEAIAADLVARYIPAFWFHRDELNLPVAYPDLLLKSQLATPEGKIVMQLTPDKKTPEQYLTEVVDYSLVHPCRLAVPKSLFPGSLDSPVYAWVRETPDLYAVSYTVVFAYNGPTVLGLIGAHTTDIEHVTVRVNRKTLEVRDVYFGAHGTNDGVWRKKGEFQEYHSRPVVYVAKTSHAMYPEPGTYVFGYGFAVDRAQVGISWTPNAQLISTIPPPAWLHYNGENALGTKPYLRNDEPLMQTTPLRRFFNTGGPGCMCLGKIYQG